LDGCERILRDEFKDYPESALYMIGAINEAKGKSKPGPSAAEPKSKSGADLTSAAKATLEPHPIPGAKPQPTLEHAGDAHES
jgi:F-type H+-transporting ATPase subunit beta